MNMEKKIKKIFLVGFMGSGKTTVGKLLAKKLKTNFIDIDEEIELQEGLTIPAIFSIKGENYFRQLEMKILKKIANSDFEGVIATGGGLGANPEAMKIMKEKGIVIWLDIDFQIFKKRTQGDKNRPLIKKKEEELKKLFEERKKIYSQAHIRVKSQKSPSHTVKMILKDLKNLKIS